MAIWQVMVFPPVAVVLRLLYYRVTFMGRMKVYAVNDRILSFHCMAIGKAQCFWYSDIIKLMLSGENSPAGSRQIVW